LTEKKDARIVETFHYDVNIDSPEEYLQFKEIRKEEEQEKKKKKRRTVLLYSLLSVVIFVIIFIVPIDATGKTIASSILLSFASILSNFKKGDNDV